MQSRLLNINPLVAIFDDVFDEEIAQAAIEAGKDRLERPTYGTSEAYCRRETYKPCRPDRPVVPSPADRADDAYFITGPDAPGTRRNVQASTL